MKQVHYSRKTRQLGRLVKELKVALDKRDQSVSFIDRLKLKIKLLIHQLTGILSKHQLKGILGSAAVVFGLALSNNANAQSFAAPSQNPFGITTNPSELGDVDFLDLDGDGDLDILQGGYYGVLEYFENTGTATVPVFAGSTQNPFGLTQTYYFAAPTAADLDNDGDLDLLVGEYYGNMMYFENTGTANAPAFAAGVSNPFGITQAYQFAFPEFVDLDGDGDMDLLVGEYYGTLQFYENTGTISTPAFAAPVANPNNITVGSYASIPAIIDLDGDGDFDLLIGEYGGNMQYLENIGTANAPNFTAPVQNPFGLVAVPDFAFPSFGDLDGDSDFDLMVGEQYGNMQYFENTSINVSVPELDNSANVYPNPFIDEISIESNYAIDRIEIYTVSGKLASSIDNPGKVLNLEDLEQGMYILNAINNDRVKTSHKLTKQ